EGYEYGSFHFLEPSFLHNYTDSTAFNGEDLDKYGSDRYISNLYISIYIYYTSYYIISDGDPSYEIDSNSYSLK
ncbi:hypothetical protein ABNF72_20590, partial [Paenibacillus larvae]